MASNDTYILKAKEKYRELFYELVLRAHRGAVMMYREAHETEKRLEWGIKYIPKAFCGLGIIGRFLQEAGQLPASPMAKISTLSLAAFALVVDAYIDNSNTMKDILRNKSQVYIKAASNWQRLEKKANAYIIIIDDPTTPIADIHKAYNELVEERAEITSSVIVPHERYESTKLSDIVEKITENKEQLERYIAMRTAN